MPSGVLRNDDSPYCPNRGTSAPNRGPRRKEDDPAQRTFRATMKRGAMVASRAHRGVHIGRVLSAGLQLVALGCPGAREGGRTFRGQPILLGRLLKLPPIRPQPTGNPGIWVEGRRAGTHARPSASINKKRASTTGRKLWKPISVRNGITSF